MSAINPSKRGRPVGYIMSNESKNKISLKLKGRVLTEEHRYKISIAMVGNKNRLKKNGPTLIDDLYLEYVSDYSDEDIGVWIASIHDKLVLCSGISSSRRLSSHSFMEISVDSIDQFCGDCLDPEVLLILAETVKELSLRAEKDN